MIRPSRAICWFATVAYFWVAMGIAEAAQLGAVDRDCGPTSVIVNTAASDELFVHHLGHRDGHEQQAQALDDAAGVKQLAQDDTHADHVIKLNCSQEFSGLASKVYSLPVTIAVFAAAHDYLNATRILPATAAQVVTYHSRNSATAVLKLTRLRI